MTKEADRADRDRWVSEQMATAPAPGPRQQAGLRSILASVKLGAEIALAA